ncbi:MAG TPA: hypothetical protein VJ488_02185 [Dehalococcoidia bacterium]|nr:hypothetical protein [Dehalococcoidia bacterium]
MRQILSVYPAKYDTMFKAVLALPLAIMAYSGIEMARTNPDATWALAGTCAFVAILFWLIMPRKFLITDNSLKFILGASLSFNVTFAKIREARALKGVGFGINFATSFKEPVEIIRTKGLNINFSPQDRYKFLKDFDLALQNWRKNTSSYDQSH